MQSVSRVQSGTETTVTSRPSEKGAAGWILLKKVLAPWSCQLPFLHS
jgi:hypothetical protein